MNFHDGLAWLMQIAMFLALGLLVFPSQLVPIAWIGLLISAFLMLIARPLSVFALLHFAGLGKAETIFNIVFFIVITSVLFQGTTIPFAARFLKVDAPIIPEPEYLTKCDIETSLKGKLKELKAPKSSAAAGKQIVDLGLPNDVLIIMLRRNGNLLIPSGKTILEPDDMLLVLSNSGSLDALQSILDTKGD